MKKVLNLLDKSFPFLLLAAALCFSIVTKESVFLTSLTLAGVLCVVLAARGNIWTYPVGLYNCVAYAYVAYSNGLYGEMGLNLFFFLPTSILGWFLWRKKLKDNIVLMRRMSGYKRVFLFVTCILATLALGFGLSFIPTQNTPYIDALTNVLSIVATLLMMYRFQEQWFLYITLNIFTITMWTIRMANGSAEGKMMIVMWSLYLINSFYGAVKWHIGANKNKKEVLL